MNLLPATAPESSPLYESNDRFEPASYSQPIDTVDSLDSQPDCVSQTPNPNPVESDVVEMQPAYIPHDIDLDSPLSIFRLLLPDSIWHTVVRNTNMNARQRKHTSGRERPWHPTTYSEIMVFIGIVIYMGTFKSPQVSMYWSTDRREGPVHPIQFHMSLVRYEQLRRYLHISQVEIIGPYPDNAEARTSASITRPVFENQPQNRLQIPAVIDDYNRRMKGVDEADELHAEHVSQSCNSQVWWPLFNWIIDTATVNAHRIHRALKAERSLRSTSHLKFRQILFDQLLHFSKTPDSPRGMRKYLELPSCRHDTTLSHRLVQMPKGHQRRCTWCVYKQKKQKEATNARRAADSHKSGWSCYSCKVSLCHDRTGRPCRKEFHNMT